jgi:hypothetical protein
VTQSMCCATLPASFGFKKVLVPQTGFEPVTPSLRMTYTLFGRAFRNLGYFRVRAYNPLNNCFFVDTPSY